MARAPPSYAQALSVPFKISYAGSFTPLVFSRDPQIATTDSSMGVGTHMREVADVGHDVRYQFAGDNHRLTNFVQFVGEYRAAVLGTSVIVALASVMAIGFAAVVDQLAHNGAGAHISQAASFGRTFAVGYAASPASTGLASPDGCCTWDSTENGPRSDSRSPLPDGAAPNENRLFERR